MKSRAASSEDTVAKCPNCAAPIHAPPSTRRRRAQCPKCREIIQLDGTPAEAKGAEVRPALVVPQADEVAVLRARVAEVPILRARLDEFATLRSRVDEVSMLKDRVQALEAAMASLQHAVMDASRGAKMRWVAPGAQPIFSEFQAEALRDNLATLAPDNITIEAVRDDIRAREQAQWFKTVFTDANWSVCGPEDAPLGRATRRGISIATGLPVTSKAATTYLAVRAAGFDIATVFDADLNGSEPRLVVV